MLVLKVGMSYLLIRGVMHKSYHMVIRYLSLYLVFDLVFQTLSKRPNRIGSLENLRKK
jgi:hypothetical protein